jgi:hypothetical protein
MQAINEKLTLNMIWNIERTILSNKIGMFGSSKVELILPP